MNRYVVGIDEVGRGPIAGPVSVCVCMMTRTHYSRMQWKRLTDSKKMTPKARMVWAKEAEHLRVRGVLKYSVISVSAEMIDKKGISHALRSCIRRGLTILSVDPKNTTVLLDGSLYAPEGFIQKTIIKGDQKEPIISLASVIAKVTRDAYMMRLHKTYPLYGWAQNKGYGTKKHYEALTRYGRTPLHRKTFLGDKKEYE